MHIYWKYAHFGSWVEETIALRYGWAGDTIALQSPGNWNPCELVGVAQDGLLPAGIHG